MKKSASNLPPCRPTGIRWRHTIPRSRRNSDGPAAILFLLPSLLGTAAFMLVPLQKRSAAAFAMHWGKRFVGLANYQSVLEKHSAFNWQPAIRYGFSAPVCRSSCCAAFFWPLGVQAVARQRNGRDTRRGKVFRTSFLLPMAIPVASIVILWKVLFAKNGLVNGLICSLGGHAVDFMGTEAAFWVLVFTYVWKNAGYDMILWLAGLDGISADLYEAASVDGANAWQKFFLHHTAQLAAHLDFGKCAESAQQFQSLPRGFPGGRKLPPRKYVSVAASVQQLVSVPGSAPA